MCSAMFFYNFHFFSHYTVCFYLCSGAYFNNFNVFTNSIISVIAMYVSIYLFFSSYGSHFSLSCMFSNCSMATGYFELYVVKC